MDKLIKLLNAFREDVNHQDSVIVENMGSFTEVLFSGIKWFGFPFFVCTFLLYVLN